MVENKESHCPVDGCLRTINPESPTGTCTECTEVIMAVEYALPRMKILKAIIKQVTAKQLVGPGGLPITTEQTRF